MEMQKIKTIRKNNFTWSYLVKYRLWHTSTLCRWKNKTKHYVRVKNCGSFHWKTYFTKYNLFKTIFGEKDPHLSNIFAHSIVVPPDWANFDIPKTFHTIVKITAKTFNSTVVIINRETCYTLWAARQQNRSPRCFIQRFWPIDNFPEICNGYRANSVSLEDRR